STEGLRSLGLPVNELTRLQQEAKESGKDIRALTAEWLAAQAEMRQGLIGEQMKNEERTLAGVGRAIRDIVSEAANTQQMRDAIEALAEAFQKLLPVIEAVANFISNNLAEVIVSLSDPVADLKGELKMLEIMFLRTRANLQFWASEQEKREWRSQ